MARISRSRASFRIWGDDLNPDELTASLGRGPDLSHTKGQEIKGKVTGHVRVAKTGMWRIKAKAREPGDLDAQIHELFGSLTPDLSIWRNLATKYKSDLFVGLFMEKGNEVLEISVESLGILSSREVELVFDIYGPVDDDDVDEVMV